MSESFLAYSLSVITSRAIPDVRDGLKPVQRRILYSMQQMGLRPDRPHRKCAQRRWATRWAATTPTATARSTRRSSAMAQPFARNVTPRRSARQLRLARRPAGRAPLHRVPPDRRRGRDAARARRRDGRFPRPPTTASTTEPVYLPALLPNLLVNGTTGIAVGMATNMPTHNLREVVRRDQARPDEAPAQARRSTRSSPCCPGPTSRRGGVADRRRLREAYETGRGSFRMRAKAEVERITTHARRHRRHRAAVHRRARAGHRPHPGARAATARSPASPTSRTSAIVARGLRIQIELQAGGANAAGAC